MSWSGTVRCGNCYKEGHNKTTCPKLRKAWEEDPTSHLGRQWQKIMARKAKPKVCGYCDETGHTRAGCGIAKKHKAQFQIDLNLWGRAMTKWMEDIGLGVGALVQNVDAIIYRGTTRTFPVDPGYIPPVGLVLGSRTTEGGLCGGSDLPSHFLGIAGSSAWCARNDYIFFAYEPVGVDLKKVPVWRRNVTVSYPCIPGIIPRRALNSWGNELDRKNMADNTDWSVVSTPSTKPDHSEVFSPATRKTILKRHFVAAAHNTVGTFRTFGDFQRKQLEQYVNGEVELSEMKDPAPYLYPEGHPLHNPHRFRKTSPQ